jgi:hypothetical protein
MAGKATNRAIRMALRREAYQHAFTMTAYKDRRVEFVPTDDVMPVYYLNPWFSVTDGRHAGDFEATGRFVTTVVWPADEPVTVEIVYDGADLVAAVEAGAARITDTAYARGEA